MGLEFPASGRGTFHLMFSVALQLSGKVFSLEIPVPSGPRQFGQFSANAAFAMRMNDRRDGRMPGVFSLLLANREAPKVD